ncbi:hypothetical protein AYY22_21475 [Photobacterium kishitanii]|uniref:hypothetical protein n=1 Tax=Photobacterium kishitanii TaxID=318456 RepID=UPI0007EFEFDD|nr:hypothetical protein [Photobacterium kishitanii]OBU24377.1 hypothetical protein AYY22_21475 [Photobacterium kishitanii]
MKKLFYITIITIVLSTTAWGMDNTTNTTSIDLSQNLSKQDIIKVNLAHAYYIYGGNPKRAIALLKSYIDDKKKYQSSVYLCISIITL